MSPARKTPDNASWSFARIDPDGEIVATWRTWVLILGVTAWVSMLYYRIDQGLDDIKEMSRMVNQHRQVLIHAGMIKPDTSTNKDTLQ